MRTTYKVTARKWRLGWELRIEGVGVTQSCGLGDAEAAVRHYVADEFGVAEDSFDVEIAPEVGDGLDAEVGATRAKLREVEARRGVALDGLVVRLLDH